MWNQGMEMEVKLLHKDAVVPSYAHNGDSGMDLYTVEDIEIQPNSTGIAPTGIAVALPPFTEMQIRNRSGITVKGCKCKIIRIAIGSKNNNTGTYKPIRIDEMCKEEVKLGTVDNPYRGEIGIMVYNNENTTVMIPKGTKLAQAVVCPVLTVTPRIVEELSTTLRGSNGYGSTGM